jgi:hypothetical protein
MFPDGKLVPPQSSSIIHIIFKSMIYLFNSSALFFKSSLLSGVGKLSACTGPCLFVSFHLNPPNQLGEARTGFALCALACRLPPLLALSVSGSSWSGCDEAVLSEDSLATLSVMPGELAGISYGDI